MTIAHVQSKAASGASTTPQATLDAAPTQNNILVAMVSVQGTRTLTLNSGAGWTAATGSPVTSSDTGGLYYKTVGAGESATQQPVTSDSGSAVWTITITEYSGVTTSSPLEVATGNSDSDATKTTTGTADPTDSVERLIVGGAFDSNNGSWSAQKVNGSTTGVTERGDIGNGTASNQTSSTLFDKVEASTASGNYTTEAVASGTAANGAAFIAIFKPAAGTQYNQSVSGGITPAGAISKQDNKVLSGSVSAIAGAIAKQTSKAFSGAISSIAGTITKQGQKVLSGLVSSVVGALVKSTDKPLTGDIVPAGVITKQTSKTLSGAVATIAGVLDTIRLFVISLSGDAVPTGTITKQSNKTLSGSISSAGETSKQTSKILSGAVTGITGALETIRLFVISLSGSVVPFGEVSKTTNKILSGVLASFGGISKTISKFLSGIVSNIAGVLTRVLNPGPGEATAHYIYVIPAESRVYLIPAIVEETTADRTFIIPAESRIYQVPHD